MLSPINSIKFGTTSNYKREFTSPKAFNPQPSFCALKRPNKLASLIGGLIMAFGATSAKAAEKAGGKTSVSELLQVFKGRITTEITHQNGGTTFKYVDATTQKYAGELQLKGVQTEITIPQADNCRMIFKDNDGDGFIDKAPQIDCKKLEIVRQKF